MFNKKFIDIINNINMIYTLISFCKCLIHYGITMPVILV